MKKKYLYLFLVMFSIAISAQAEEPLFPKETCTPVDLRKEPKEKAAIFENTRDQGESGWCVAYTLSDLFGYRYNKKFSAVEAACGINDISLQSYNRINPVTKERERPYSHITNRSAHNKDFVYDRSRSLLAGGGNPFYAIDDLKQAGLCLEENFKSESGTESLNAYKPIIEKALEREKGLPITDESLDQCCKTMQSITPNLSLENIKNVFHIRKTASNVIAGISNGACEPRFDDGGKLKNLGHESINLVGNPDLKKYAAGIIQKQLTKNEPFALGYSAIGITDYGNGLHTSLVIGREFRNGKCEFLIRNSWGKSCEVYRDPSQCEEGNIWVDLEKMMLSSSTINGEVFPNVQNIHYLK